MSLVTDLPAIFDQFSEARQKGFLTVMDLKERGIPLVGTYCTFMPQEIPMAAGAVVVSLCSTSDETIEEAEKDLPRNLCPLIKSSYGFGKTDKCPYFYFSDLVVGETTCDGKKKMYEYMAEFKPVHVMQLPNSVKDDASRALWKAEMLRLQKTVEERFGHEISEDALRDAIALKNRERRALANFYHLGQLNPPALSGSDILKVVYGATFRFDKEALINELDAMTARVRQQWEEGQRLDPAGLSVMKTAPGRKPPSNAWRKRVMCTTRWRINIWRLAAPVFRRTISACKCSARWLKNIRSMA